MLDLLQQRMSENKEISDKTVYSMLKFIINSAEDICIDEEIERSENSMRMEELEILAEKVAEYLQNEDEWFLGAPWFF